MNLNLNHLYFLVITLFSISCISAVESTANDQFSDKLCQQAKNGNLKLASYDDPKLNSFLFDCVVVVSIPGINKSSNSSQTKAQRKIEKQKLIKTADFLLSQKIDIKFKNKYGDTLLMTAIFSYFDESWKEKTVAKMIELGVNINEKNKDGYSAFDFANSNKNKNIIKLLTNTTK